MTCQALIRLSMSLVAAAMLNGCETRLQLDHREVSARVKARLAANSRALNAREVEGTDIKIEATIVAEGPFALSMFVRDGVPFVPARINRGVLVPVVVDTGSQGCVMEARTALANDVTLLDHEHASMTLGGTTGNEEAWIGLPDEFAIGSWVLKQFPFFVRTHETRVRLGLWNNHDISVDLIGMNAILKSCHYLTLDFPAKRVVFGIGEGFSPPSHKAAWKAPLLLRNGLPYVQLQTEGRSWTALVDSGFNGLLDMDVATAQRLRLLEKARPTDAFRIGLGAPAKGEASQFGVVSLSKLDSLGPHMVNLPTLIVPQRSKIGCALLRPFRVTLDFDRQLLWLENPKQRPTMKTIVVPHLGGKNAVPTSAADPT